MNKTKNKNLTSFSQKLRCEMTKEERKLWYDFLKQLPITVNRQKVFNKYIVDFYIASVNLVIELDGSQHYDEDNLKADKERDEYFDKLGIKVLRYTNLEVIKNFNDVCNDILKYLSC